MLSALRAGVLSFASPKERSQRKGDPQVGAGFAGSLRYSPLAGAAELGSTPLRQSSPFFRQYLRCSAPLKGPGKPPVAKQGNFNFGHFFGPTVAFEANRSLNPDAFRVPLRGAEQRRRAGGFRRGLFEGRRPEFRSRPAHRVAQGTGAAGADPGVAFSLLTFFWRSKRK